MVMCWVPQPAGLSILFSSGKDSVYTLFEHLQLFSPWGLLSTMLSVWFPSAPSCIQEPDSMSHSQAWGRRPYEQSWPCGLRALLRYRILGFRASLPHAEVPNSGPLIVALLAGNCHVEAEVKQISDCLKTQPSVRDTEATNRETASMSQLTGDR